MPDSRSDPIVDVWMEPRNYAKTHKNAPDIAGAEKHYSLFTVHCPLPYVPDSQLFIYSTISGVSTSILTPMAWSLSEAIS